MNEIALAVKAPGGVAGACSDAASSYRTKPLEALFVAREETGARAAEAEAEAEAGAAEAALVAAEAER